MPAETTQVPTQGSKAAARARGVEEQLTADRRLLARFDGDAGRWHVADGAYQVSLGEAADDLVLDGEASLAEASFAD